MKQQIVELKIVLLNTKPSVYRTIQINHDATFFELHVAIQIAFGWENSHLHMFMINNEEIGNEEFDEFEDQNTLNQLSITLNQKIIFEKQKLLYVYDFGDNWEHEITVTKFLEAKNTFYPKCIRGSRNRPPEDCGGVWGFEEFKEIMGNRKHPAFKEMKLWHGGMYDEDYFLKDNANNDFKQFSDFVNNMMADEY